MFIVVAYDIEDDKLRTRLHKTLRRFGEPVQYSVFECILTNDRFAEMRMLVTQVLEGRTRGVRYYEMCEGCNREVVTIGIARTTKLRPVYIV